MEGFLTQFLPHSNSLTMLTKLKTDDLLVQLPKESNCFISTAFSAILQDICLADYKLVSAYNTGVLNCSQQDTVKMFALMTMTLCKDLNTELTLSHSEQRVCGNPSSGITHHA